MARARNIKPGFFTNEDLVELGFATRLLFAGLWTIADREGRLEDRPKKIKMGIFPADDVNVDVMLQELHDAKFVQRYEVNGVRYIQITNWSKHQNPHHTEKASEIPGIDSEITVKAPLKTGDSPKSDGGNLADSLIPDSLIPDSPSPLRSEGEGACAPPPPIPAEPKKPKAEARTLSAYLADCRAAGCKPVPDGHAVRRWADDAGIAPEMLQIAWLQFRERYTEDEKGKRKRYTDWPAHFATAVKANWFKLWFQGDSGMAWTSIGMTHKQVLDKRHAAQHAEEEAHEPA